MRILILILITQINLIANPLTVEIEELPTEPIVEVIPTVLMIDDFENGDFISPKEWWTFGKVIINGKMIENRAHYHGKISMEVSAQSNNWYAGGIGAYIGEPVHHFGILKLVIFSPKINSGSIRIQLYDDDNNNKIVDIDSETNQASKDDLFIYDLNLTWEGWKIVSIPINEFVDYNESIGDNNWNPNDEFGSAGLLQIQFIILSSKYQSENINFEIDTIKFNR